ncbi:hypothetical protein ABVT39_018681 [Epinephelus coioides]
MSTPQYHIVTRVNKQKLRICQAQVASRFHFPQTQLCVRRMSQLKAHFHNCMTPKIIEESEP